jgi:hypothetical protein
LRVSTGFSPVSPVTTKAFFRTLDNSSTKGQG